MNKTNQLRLLKSFNFSRFQKEKLIKLINNNSSIKDSDNTFDFKVYVNGHEDIGSDYDTNSDIISKEELCGDVSYDILINLPAYIFHIFDNKLYLYFSSTSDSTWEILVKDKNLNSIAEFALNIETDEEDGTLALFVVYASLFDVAPDNYKRFGEAIIRGFTYAFESINIEHLYSIRSKYPATDAGW